MHDFRLIRPVCRAVVRRQKTISDQGLQQDNGDAEHVSNVDDTAYR